MRILIVSASVGTGHLRAAEAVELAFRQLQPQATVKNIDILSLANKSFHYLYGDSYVDMVSLAPHMLGYFYDMLDKPSHPWSDKLRLVWEKLNLKPFIRLLRQGWDLVVNTHFLPAEIIANLLTNGKVSATMKQVTVTTDFEIHRLWVNQPCSHYFVATAEGSSHLQSYGVPTANITVSGIPIHPSFSEPKNREQCLQQFGLHGDRPIILQLTNSEPAYQQLLAIEQPLEIAVACGRSKKVQNSLRAIELPARHNVKIFGYIDQIDELMAVSDLIVSKPGGLISSEALSQGVPLAIVNPIPGQENRNSDYLLENGAAVKINNIATLAHKVEDVLRNRLPQLKTNARRLGRPHAALEVAKRSIMELL